MASDDVRGGLYSQRVSARASQAAAELFLPRQRQRRVTSRVTSSQLKTLGRPPKRLVARQASSHAHPTSHLPLINFPISTSPATISIS